MTLNDPVARDRLAEFIRRAAGARDVKIIALERITSGAIQENWALDVELSDGSRPAAQRWVLRTDARATVRESLTRAKEFTVLQVAHAAEVYAPRPLWRCEDPAVAGRPFFIMERLPGVAAGHKVTRDADLVPDPARLARELAANLARLHQIKPPHPCLAFLETTLARDNIAHYRGYLDTLPEPYPVLEWGLRWCEINAPAHEEITFIHRDYRTGNYLVHNGHLTGVLDWEFAGFGNPLEDVGWIFARCWRFARSDLPVGGIANPPDFLILGSGLVFGRVDGSARLARVPARGVGKIGRCEAQIPGKTARLERIFTRLTLLRASDRVPIGEKWRLK